MSVRAWTTTNVAAFDFACDVESHRHEALAGESLSPRCLIDDRHLGRQRDPMLFNPSLPTFRAAEEDTVHRGN